MRVVAVIVGLIVAAAALHGYLPGGEPPPRERPTNSFGSLFAVGAMLAASMAIIAIAILTQSRRRSVSPGAGGLPREMAGARRPLTWRMVLIAAGVVIAWLLLTALLSRMSVQLGIEQPPPDAGSPPSGAARSPVQQPAEPESPSGVFSLLAGTTVLLMIAIFVGALNASRRQRQATTSQFWAGDEYRTPPTAGPESLARAAALGLAEIGDLSREPREAIIACYLAMERELDKAPDAVPQDSDTPSEVLARAVERRGLGMRSATQLVELFEEARFSPHIMTESHRDDAVHALQQVLNELQASS